MSDKKSDLVNLGGLWKNEKGFLSGKLGGANLYVFPNKQKQGPKHPDYTVCVGRPQPKKKPEETQDDSSFDF